LPSCSADIDVQDLGSLQRRQARIGIFIVDRGTNILLCFMRTRETVETRKNVPPSRFLRFHHFIGQCRYHGMQGHGMAPTPPQMTYLLRSRPRIYFITSKPSRSIINGNMSFNTRAATSNDPDTSLTTGLLSDSSGLESGSDVLTSSAATADIAAVPFSKYLALVELETNRRLS
jgi:hypothetical protein